MNMEYFLSCDWGTSTFRLKLINTGDLDVMAEVSTGEGIASTYKLWQQTTSDSTRLDFYKNFLANKIRQIEKQVSVSLDGVPVIISGMASSSIGMVELAYKNIPLNADGSDLITYTINSDASFKHLIFIISGATNKCDVMRGEETKLAGCYSSKSSLYLFPGTHSKHIQIEDGKIVDFKTYMTGEIFDTLSKNTILALSVKKGEGLNEPKNFENFEKGVLVSRHSNILHNCFLVRANILFNKLTEEENYYYLSGLLIGTELGDLQVNNSDKITLAANSTLLPAYTFALDILNLVAKSKLIIVDADEIVTKGQLSVFNFIKSNSFLTS